MENYCPFCDIEVLSKQTIKEYSSVLVLYNYAPITRGHVLVIPKKHQTNFSEISAEIINEMMCIIGQVSQKFEKYLKTDGFSYQLNEGHHAGQEVMHAHFHVVPRYKHDNLSKPYDPVNIDSKVYQYIKQKTDLFHIKDRFKIDFSDKPRSNGHTNIIFPGKTRIRDLSNDDVNNLSNIILNLVQLYKTQFKPDGFNYNISEINPNEGDIFDPNFHQSVELIICEDKDKDNTIAFVLQKGYKGQNKVLRPARVNVFSFKS